MSTHTDSEIVQYNEDGSWTTTTVVTEYPATNKEKAIAGTVLAGLLVAPFVPLIAYAVTDAWERRQERKAAKKAQQDKNN